MSSHHKVQFTDDDDALLMKFIATYNPHTRGRLGIKLYERLVANEEGKWSFASRHPTQSWRERYKTNQRWFDAKILRYQKKHGISPNAPAVSPRATGKSSTGNTSAHVALSRNSPSPSGGSGSKKRAREVDANDLSLNPSPAKRMRRENVTVQESRTRDVAPHPVSPRLAPQNKGKGRAEFSSPPCHEEDRDQPVAGPDDYYGALDAESDQGEESQSDGGHGNESSSPLPPSSPIKKAQSKPSANSKKPTRATVTEGLSQPLASSSRQQHSPEQSPSATHPSAQPASKASGSRRKLVITPPQLSQEPTPPHSSPRNSPGPSPRENSHPTSPPPQSGTARKPQRVASLRQRRSRVIVDEEEDDIFCTPPVQSPPSSPPPRARARDAPRLVEGPYRSAYTRANGSHRPAPRGRHASEDSEEVEANGNDWPPRRGKQDDPIPSQERSTPTTDVDRASVQHIDLRVLHSRKSVEKFRASSSSNRSFGSTSRALVVKKTRSRQAKVPRSSTPPNLSESNKELVLALGLEAVYKRMADNHKFHIDIVREVAARQRSLEQADQVLRSMREAAEHEYARLLKREFGAHQTEENDEEAEAEEDEEEEEEEEEEEVAKNLTNEEHDHSTPSRSPSPHSIQSPPDFSMINGDGYVEEDADAMEMDEVPANQAHSPLPGSQALPDVEWTDNDDELLLDGDLVVHEELVRRKGLGSVKFRTAHLYSLLLDG